MAYFLNNSPMTGIALKAQGLYASRGSRQIYRRKTFQLAAGEGLVVSGPNGCGKSTLLRQLCGLLPLERGAVHWCGEKMRRDFSSLQSQLVYLGHALGLQSHLTVMENLVQCYGLGEHVRLAQALDALQLTSLVQRPLAQLSAGQARKTALIRFLLSDAPLWIVDEPLTYLDKSSRSFIQNVFQDHLAKGGILVMASHDEHAGLNRCQRLRMKHVS